MTHNRSVRAAAALVLGLLAFAAPAAAGDGPAGAANSSMRATRLAVIGDTPYGPAQVAGFDDFVAAVNDDPAVRTVLHVGDIKNGSSRCDDTYFAGIRASFDRFEDPVVYTPGDNEWTDCHRTSNGAYDPIERLDAIRSTFFGQPGRTLGRRARRVETQGAMAGRGTFVENVRWVGSQVAFATVHVVGSDNGRLPWTVDQPERRQAEVDARTTAALEWVAATFDAAEAGGLRGVVLAMQADTWTASGATRSAGFAEINDLIATRAAAFDGDVLVLQGDTHGYAADTPTPNVQRVVVEGETISEYLRLTVDPRAEQLFTIERSRR